MRMFWMIIFGFLSVANMVMAVLTMFDAVPLMEYKSLHIITWALLGITACHAFQFEIMEGKSK